MNRRRATRLTLRWIVTSEGLRMQWTLGHALSASDLQPTQGAAEPASIADQLAFLPERPAPLQVAVA